MDGGETEASLPVLSTLNSFMECVPGCAFHLMSAPILSCTLSHAVNL